MIETHCEQVLKHLKSGKSITHLEALRLFECARLSARIKDLREAGHPIETTMIDVKTRSGRKARVARYRLVRRRAVRDGAV